MGMSLTMGSLFAGLIVTVAKNAGVDIDVASLHTTAATLLQLLSVAGVWYGRVRLGDITWFGLRKAAPAPAN